MPLDKLQATHKIQGETWSVRAFQSRKLVAKSIQSFLRNFNWLFSEAANQVPGAGRNFLNLQKRVFGVDSNLKLEDFGRSRSVFQFSNLQIFEFCNSKELSGKVKA